MRNGRKCLMLTPRKGRMGYGRFVCTIISPRGEKIMTIPNYGVLRCKAIARKREESGDTPHYQVHVTAAGADYRLAVNARSQTNPPDLLFIVEEDFKHPITVQLGEV